MSSPDDTIDTLLVGIDAACATVVDPLLESNSLPTLAELFDEGMRGPLQSQIPPWTPSAWPTIYTGVNPGKHGLFGFLRYDGYGWDVVNYGDVGELSLWGILGMHEKTSVVVNVPVTAPPTPFDGALVPGYIAPEEPATVPEDVLERIRDACGAYRVYPDPDGDPHQEYPAVVAMRGDAFCHLADAYAPDFGFVQFQVTDSVFHEHPDDWELVEAIYRTVDEQIGRLVERYEPDTVLVVSDHGMGRYDEYEFRVNDFLAQEGYLDKTIGEEGMPAWLPILDEQLRNADGDAQQSSPGFLPRVIRIAARTGLTPERVGRMLRVLRVDQLVRDRLSASAKRAGRLQVDFPASTAYMRSRIELGIRLNVTGREPDGIVSPDEYDAVRDELIDRLSDVETPDGSPVFDDVAPAEEYFWGPYADEGVDIVTIPAGFDQFLSADLKGDRFGDPPEPWNHKMEGLVAMAGDGIDPADGVDDADLLDVAPTVLATMGVPASDRMDGGVLDPFESPGSRSYPTIDRDRGEHDGTDAVEDRLEAIGYL